LNFIEGEQKGDGETSDAKAWLYGAYGHLSCTNITRFYALSWIECGTGLRIWASEPYLAIKAPITS
jgi:hypothetical protein